MASTGAKRHTHKYFKMENGLWGCGFPDCTHFMPYNMKGMMKGKLSICWRCGDEMRLGPSELEMIEPICLTCVTFADTGVRIEDVADFVTKHESQIRLKKRQEEAEEKARLAEFERLKSQQTKPEKQEDIIEIDEPTSESESNG